MSKGDKIFIAGHRGPVDDAAVHNLHKVGGILANNSYPAEFIRDNLAIQNNIIQTVYTGRVVFDASKPDGTPRKLMDVGLLCNAGWTASTPMRTGLTVAYQDFLTLNTQS